jgi:hypothetical protein
MQPFVVRRALAALPFRETQGHRFAVLHENAEFLIAAAFPAPAVLGAPLPQATPCACVWHEAAAAV